jgi:hypothetical protein
MTAPPDQRPKPPRVPRRTLAASLWTALLTALLLAVGGLAAWLYLDGVALKLVLPDPKPPPPTAATWDDPRIGALADPHLRCTQRMSALLAIPGCCLTKTIVHGDEVTCAMDHPPGALSFGCGPYGDAPPRPFAPRASITADDTTWLAIQAQRWLGDCRPQAVGPVVGQPPRWPGDQGDAACFWLGGFHPLARSPDFPHGLFASLQPLPMIGEAAASWAGRARPPAPLPNTLPLLALRLDATHLAPGERAQVQGLLHKLFTRPDYVRSALSLKMEAYLRGDLPPAP